jgi:DNA-binding SARP family transcriptional activator
MSRERILSVLWPVGDPERNRHALTQSLYHSRKALGCDDVFLLAGGDIRLNAERMKSDVQGFVSLFMQGDDECAVELYRGEFLEGFFVPGIAEFDHWVSNQRVRLRDLAGQAYERLASAAESQRNLARAIEWRKRLVSLDPLSAVPTAKLMRIMAASGDRSGALQQARVHILLLRDQLEIDPDPIVSRLEEQIRSAPIEPSGSPVDDAGGHITRQPAEVALAPSSPSEAAVEPTTALTSDGAARARPASRRWRLRPAPYSRLLRVAAWVVLAAAALGLAFSAGRRGRTVAAAPAPANGAAPLLVVAPFRVSGADASLSYLRDGVVELLSQRLASDSVAHAVDPGVVLGAWRGAEPAASADLARSTATTIARQLGASRVVVGSVVGSPARLVMNAALLALPSGELRGQATVEGPVDSITTLVDHLAVRLLASSAGEGARLSSRATPSLAAVQAFLDGQAAYRRGDYAAAVPQYEHALAHDSSFALAALQLALAADRLNDAEQHDRALAIAWAHRKELDDRDAAHLVAFAGPRYPAPSTEREQLAAWENALTLAPDRADVWFELGERFFRSGAVVGVRDSHVRAMAALTRALQLDPGHARARRLLIQLAARRMDTTLLNRIATPAALRDSMGELSAFLRWRVALARGDSMELRRVRAMLPRLADQNLRAIAMASINDAVAVDDGERAARISAERASRSAQQLDALLEQHTFALNEGRPLVALAVTEQMEERMPGTRAHLRLRVLDALYSEGDSAAAESAAAELSAVVDAPARTADAKALQPADLCVLEQWRVAHGATGETRRSIARLRAAGLPRTAVPVGANPLTCAELLDASWSVVTRQADALQRVAALDSLMLSGPAVSDAGTYANITVGRLYERLGQPRAALEGYRRRSYMSGWPRYLATIRREEARIASSIGEPAIATSSYGRYLALRRAPEPKVVAEVESVRQSLEALVVPASVHGPRQRASSAARTLR